MAKVNQQSPLSNSVITENKTRKRRSNWLLFFLGVDLALLVVILLAISFIYFSARLERVNHITERMGILDYFLLLINPRDDLSTDMPKGRDEINTPTQFLLSTHNTESKITLLPFALNFYNSGSMNQLEYGAPSYNFYGVDFSNDELRVILTIQPPDNRVNDGKPIVIPVFPAGECEFGDKTACVTAYKSNPEGNTIFLSIHSGVGGEAQRFRHAIEGTGVDRAGYSIEEVVQNLEAIQGADVTITQDEVTISGLKLMSAARVPAGYLSEYFDTPISGALLQASYFNPGLVNYLHSEEPQLIIETCGWKMRGEPWAEEVTPTTASIYLGVIRKD